MDDVLAGIASLALYGLAFLMALWMAGAIYFDVGQGAWWGGGLTLAWLAGVLALVLFWHPLWQAVLILAGLLTVFLLWWLRQRPRHDREWDPSVARLPRAVIEGDRVTLENVRNSDYLSATESVPAYESRMLHYSNLRGVDVLFFNWGSRFMSHPILVFDFGPDGRVGISVEVRYRKGQNFAMLRSFFRQQELIFLVADERDLILRRTKFSRQQEAHLYSLNVSAETMRTAFQDHVDAINRLCETPRWYHGLCMNCTTTFYRLPHSKVRLDWRVLANARLDQALYGTGQLDRSLPFAELRRRSRINDFVNDLPKADFGDALRRELKNRRHGQ